ncbi:MAG: CoA-binding protein [Bacteroidales bacterium]|nr:CoA-binding protein [Bacteroidales bacterium]
MLKTVVLGASSNHTKFSYKCIKSLIRHGFDAVPVGKKEGQIEGIDILTGQPEIEDVHTISLYLNASKQEEYYDYILSLNPKRVIFNPGAHNQDFIDRVKEQGIEVKSDCALLMLNSGSY